MRHTTDEIRGGGIARELGFFALYLVLIVLGLFVGLVIWREALYFVFYGWIDFGWWARFLYMTTVILGSFLLVVGLLAAEPYLNTGKQKGQLLRRFVRAAVPIAAFGLIGWLVLIIGRAN